MQEWIKNLQVMEKTENYNRWIYENIQPYLGQRILEAGCGLGTMTRYLLGREFLISVDRSEECIEFMWAKFSGENLFIRKCDLSNAGILKLKHYRLDTVVCINILEHIADDLKVLRFFHELLDEGGRLVLMVPAHPSLYGTIDRSDLHYRRYKRKELNRKLQSAEFAVSRSYYFNLAGIIPWILHGKILNKSVHSEMGMLDKFVPFCALLEKTCKPPVGLSLIYICEKVAGRGRE